METSTLAAGGRRGGGSNSTTRDPKELLTTLVREFRILQCRFCKKIKGVQGKEVGIVSCYPECGTAGETQEDTVGRNVKWMGFLTKCKALDCHRCDRPIGFMEKASEDFYCGPRCQTEQKKVHNASSIRQDNNSSRSGNDGIPPIDHGRRMNSGKNNNNASSTQAAATTMAPQTSIVEVKHDTTRIASLTVVRCDEPLPGNVRRPPKSTSSTSVAAVATAPKPPATAQEKQKKQRPVESSSTSSSAPAIASVSKGPMPMPKPQKPNSETKSDRTSTKKKKRMRMTCSERTCCGHVFTRRQFFKMHRYNNHMSLEQKKEEMKKWPIKCKLCSLRFQFPSDFARHLIIHEKKKKMKSCEICGEVCTNVMELLHHLTCHMTTDQKKSEVYCPICRLWFKKPQYLLFHTTQRHAYEKN